MLRCLSPSEAKEALKEAHDGACGAHQPGPKLGYHIRRMGYYWPEMMKDAKEYAKTCHACQIHGDFKHQLVAYLAPTKATWPFEAWGIDVMGPIHPPSSKGHRFILALTDYFFKWAEAIPLREVKAIDVVKFIKHHVIYRYGVPGELYMTMAHSSLALSFPASVTSSEYRVYPQLPTILLQMGSQKLSTKPSRRFSKSSSPGASAIGTRNWVNVYGRT